ncbi:hypothetical protein PYW07_010841 [Mythimna separata]|uniref:Uncharacterized protein n=1 Tax=Mythimna separata TaxID=271217 RepID=A0AAD7Y7V0_MYTSE|nr:hypothetical protein PYW07_010841 [Mythimna separata]
MGMINSKDFRKIDEATSNSSLSNLRYVITEKPKWKVFKKKEVVPLPAYRPTKGCPCGNDGPCKQKITPKGVTIHYPQKKKKFSLSGLKPPKVQKGYFSSTTPRTVNKVKVIRQKKFPTWRLDQISCNSPFCRNYAQSHSRCCFAAKSKMNARELTSCELVPPSSLVGFQLEGPIEPASPPKPSVSSTTVVNQESVAPLNM